MSAIKWSTLAGVASIWLDGLALADRLLDEYVVRQWTQDNGLPSAQIHDVEYGPDGFLWLATANALFRFDGAASELLMRVHVPGQRIASFLPVGEDRALISMMNKVYLCNTNETPLSEPLVLRPLGSNFDFFRTRDGTVWGVAQEGVIRYGPDTPELFPAPGILSHSRENRLQYGCADTGDNLWLTSQNQVLRFDTKALSYQEITTPPQSHLGVGGFERIFAGLDGKVWLYRHPCHLFVFTPPSEWKSVETGFTHEQRLGVRTLLETSAGEIWFGTENALYRLKDGRRSDLTAADLGTPLYPAALVASHSNGLWVGLRGTGLLHLRPRAVTTLRSPDLAGRQAFYALSPMADDRIRASIAGNGLFSGPPEALRQEAATPRVRNVTVAVIHESAGKVLWLATLGHYLIRQQDHHETIVEIERASPSPTWSVTSLAETPSGVLWAGSPSGLFYVTSANPPLLRIATSQATDLITVDSSGKFYAASGRFLVGVNTETRTAKEMARLPESCSIRVLADDRSGRFWVGTNRGLYLYDRDRRVLTPAPGEWHQPTRCIQQILQAHDGRIWLGTRYGIVRLGETPDEISRQFDQTDGMENAECTGGFAPAGLVLKDGRLLFPTLDGIACVDPKRLTRATSPTVTPVIARRPATFPSGTRSATFRFSALPVSEGIDARFSWHLDDEPWSKPTAARNATFNRLTPGPHRLAVRAFNREGVCLVPAVHTFSIQPQVWQSPFFQFAVALLALAASGGTAALVTRHRAQRRIRRLAQERALDQERARIARDLHDDIGAGLTRMAMLSTQGRYIPGMPQAGNDLSARIFDTARETSRALNEIVWAANPEKDDTEQVVTYLALYAESFLRDAGIRARVLIAADIPTIRVSPSVRHPLFRAVKEAITNAAKHSKASTVTLDVRFTRGALAIEVADDGHGFVVSGTHGGNGLASMRSRLTEIGGTLTVDSVPGRGTRVSFMLPLEPPAPGSQP